MKNVLFDPWAPTQINLRFSASKIFYDSLS